MGGLSPGAAGVVASWSHQRERGSVLLADGRELPVSVLQFGRLRSTIHAGLRVVVEVEGGAVRRVDDAAAVPQSGD